MGIVNVCYSNTALSQQFAAFDDVAGSTTGEFGWEVFAGNYTDDHTTDALSSGIGSAFLSATPPSNSLGPFGGVVAGDLYAHLTTPTYTLDLGSLVIHQRCCAVCNDRGFHPSERRQNQFDRSGFLNQRNKP